MKIINLTPHNITMSNGEVFPTTKIGDKILQIRAKEEITKIGNIGEHNLYAKEFGIPYFCLTNTRGEEEEVFNGELPFANESDEILCIVSFIAMSAIKEQEGLFQYLMRPSDFVTTGKLLRNNEGKIIGVEGFSV